MQIIKAIKVTFWVLFLLMLVVLTSDDLYGDDLKRDFSTLENIEITSNEVKWTFDISEISEKQQYILDLAKLVDDLHNLDGWYVGIIGAETRFGKIRKGYSKTCGVSQVHLNYRAKGFTCKQLWDNPYLALQLGAQELKFWLNAGYSLEDSIKKYSGTYPNHPHSGEYLRRVFEVRKAIL